MRLLCFCSNVPSSNTTASPLLVKMIECYTRKVTATVGCTMRQSKMNAKISDEARDGETQQLALSVRYASVESAVKKRFSSPYGNAKVLCDINNRCDC